MLDEKGEEGAGRGRYGAVAVEGEECNNCPNRQTPEEVDLNVGKCILANMQPPQKWSVPKRPPGRQTHLQHSAICLASFLISLQKALSQLVI